MVKVHLLFVTRIRLLSRQNLLVLGRLHKRRDHLGDKRKEEPSMDGHIEQRSLIYSYLISISNWTNNPSNVLVVVIFLFFVFFLFFGLVLAHSFMNSVAFDIVKVGQFSFSKCLSSNLMIRFDHHSIHRLERDFFFHFHQQKIAF